MSPVNTYTATCQRINGWWAISVPELKGVHSQARRLDQVAAMATEAIALFLDVAQDTIAVRVQPEMPDTVERARAAREAADRARAAADKATADAIGQLLAGGLTTRDIGSLLSLSPQRISQLAPRREAKGRVAAEAVGKRGDRSRRRPHVAA